MRQGHVGPLNECLSTDMIDLLIDRLISRERETEREYHKLFVSV